MNVTESFMLQQMQQMASSMTELPQIGSNGDSSGSFQDMMAQAGKDSTAADTAQDSNATESPAQEAKTDNTVQEKPGVQKTEKDLAKNQEMNGDPTAMQYAMDLFRPEIVDVAEAEAVVETPVEVEAVVETAAVVDVPVAEETAEIPVEAEAEPIPVEEVQDSTVQQAAEPEVRQTEGTVQEAAREPVQEAQRPEEAKEPVQTASSDAPEQTAETVETKIQNAPEASNETPEEESEEPQGEAAELAQQPVFHDVEAAPVKVAENYQSVDTEAPDMDEKLADVIRQGVDDGADRIQIQLNPANLGQVTIELTRDTSGALQVALHVASGKAENLLNQHLDTLHAALQAYSQGQQVKVEVQRNEETPQQQNQHQTDPNGHNQNRQQQQQRQENRQEEHEIDFLQKLRLGLFGAGDDN